MITPPSRPIASDQRQSAGPLLTDGGSPAVVHAEYDWEEISPSLATIETVADAADCTQTALDPLYDSIDPDALNTLVRSTERQDTTVSFFFDGYDVTVHSSGLVVVRPATTE